MRVPTRSAGTRSGVNWMRWKLPRTVRGERLHRQRLGEARHAFDQQVPLREDRHQHALEEVVLADDDLLHLVEDALHQRGDIAVVVPVPWLSLRELLETATGRLRAGGILDRHREADADEHALLGRVEDAGDDADHLAVGGDQRAAGVAGIGRGVELDQVGEDALAFGASGIRASGRR